MENQNREPAYKTLAMFNDMTKELNKLTIAMAQFQNDIAYIKESVKQNNVDHKEIVEKIDGLTETFQTKIIDKADHKEVMEKIQELDEKYAPKAAWTVLVWAGTVLGGAFLISLGAFLLKLYKMF
ncbi:hypothetical protein M0R04_12870 [Candidatus Dojkabacteria bacterium]|jgi:uncharacterized coiled-coil DUF342 family protein|nr:hypothetical protein [Candidatus Dojkabacteria bacterium]